MFGAFGNPPEVGSRIFQLSSATFLDLTTVSYRVFFESQNQQITQDTDWVTASPHSHH